MPRLRPDRENPFAGWSGPRWLEVGAGGGEHAVAQVGAHPEAMLVACEVFLPGLCSLLSRLVPEGGEATAPLPANLRVWDEDARPLLRGLPDACLDRLFLLFPDPWPKSRHAKRRFVHPQRVAEMARVLRSGAEWRIASDDATYQTWVAEVFAAQSWFVVERHPQQDLSLQLRPADWPPTRYEAKAIAAGRTPHYWTARRR